MSVWFLSFKTSCPTYSLVGPLESEEALFCSASSSPKPSEAFLAGKWFLSEKVYSERVGQDVMEKKLMCFMLHECFWQKDKRIKEQKNNESDGRSQATKGNGNTETKWRILQVECWSKIWRDFVNIMFSQRLWNTPHKRVDLTSRHNKLKLIAADKRI